MLHLQPLTDWSAALYIACFLPSLGSETTPMPPLALLLLAADPTAFTWVDAIKIVCIPVLLFVMQRVFNRNDKASDEQKAKKDAEAKEREKRIDDQLRELKMQVGQFVGEETLDKRFEKVENAVTRHEKRMEGFQVQGERMADDFNRRCSAMEQQMGEVRQVRDDVATLKVEFKHITKGQDEINRKLDLLLEQRIK